MTDITPLFMTTSPSAVRTDDGYLRITGPYANDGTVEMYLTEEYDLVHIPEKKIYVRDRNIDIAEVAFTGVPGLGIIGEDVPLLRLLGCIYKPLGLPVSVFTPAAGVYSGPTVTLLRGEYRDDPSQLFWQFPEGGIPVEGETSYFYIPGVADAWVTQNGAIYTTTKAVFQKGQNREYYAVLSSADTNIIVEATKEQLAALAFGLYDEYTYDDAIYLVDGDASPSATNIVNDFQEITGFTVPRTI